MKKYTVILEHDCLFVDADYYDISDNYLDFYIDDELVCTFTPSYWKAVTIFQEYFENPKLDRRV